jgi:hypothetical protein
VFAVQRDIHTFCMTVRQYTDTTESYTCLYVQGLMGFDPVSHGFSADAPQLPACNDHISFTGLVAGFHHSVLLVMVDCVSVLPIATEDVASLNVSQ